MNAAYFRDEGLALISKKLQGHASGGRKPWILVLMDNAKVDVATAVSIVMSDLRPKRTPQPDGHDPLKKLEGRSFLSKSIHKFVHLSLEEHDLMVTWPKKSFSILN
jgi:hypothetical protein